MSRLDPLNILALDLGTTTGWALRLAVGDVHSGSQGFKPDRFEGGGMRYLRFSRFLNDLVPPNAPEIYGISMLIVFEEVHRHRGVAAAHAYGGFMATLTQWCEIRRIPYKGVPVGTIKKFATGKGNAAKDGVIKAVRAWHYEPTDDNEADALALMEWCAADEGLTHASSSDLSKRPAPNGKAGRQVQVGSVPLASKATEGGTRRVLSDTGRRNRRKRLSLIRAGQPGS